ncbi:hypothetical protein LTR86_002092 [Recurvomyces mirabilis]|nr:hypothetical protein LTR86_002092 [Recurvomyces mirabilis]
MATTKEKETRPPISYRLATRPDAPALADLISRAFRSEPTGQTWLYESQEKRVDIASPDLTRSFIESAQSLMLVGYLPSDPEKKPLSTCFLRKPSATPSEEPHRSADAAWLGFLAADPAEHGKGYGLSTLRYAEAYVHDEWGLSRLEMTYVNSRIELGAWYRRCGYVDTGRRRAFPYGEHGREILADGLEEVVIGKDLGEGVD